MNYYKGILFLSIFFLSCNSEEIWVSQVLNEIITYDKETNHLEEEFNLDSGSSTAIWMQPFEERNGLRKTVFRHYNPGLMYFERHIYFKGDEVVYALFVGESPRIVKSQSGNAESDDFLLFSKQYFFKNQSTGVLKKRQRISTEFVEKDSILKVIAEPKTEIRKINSEDYQEISKYLNEVLSLERLN